MNRQDLKNALRGAIFDSDDAQIAIISADIIASNKDKCKRFCKVLTNIFNCKENLFTAKIQALKITRSITTGNNPGFTYYLERKLMPIFKDILFSKELQNIISLKQRNRDLDHSQKVESQFYQLLYECLNEWAKNFGKNKKGKENIFSKLSFVAEPLFESFAKHEVLKISSQYDSYTELINTVTGLMNRNGDVLEITKKIKIIKASRNELKAKFDQVAEQDISSHIRIIDELNEACKQYNQWKKTINNHRKLSTPDNDTSDSRADTEEADMTSTLIRPQKVKNVVPDPKPKPPPRCDSPIDYEGKITDDFEQLPKGHYNNVPEIDLGYDPECEDWKELNKDYIRIKEKLKERKKFLKQTLKENAKLQKYNEQLTVQLSQNKKELQDAVNIAKSIKKEKKEIKNQEKAFQSVIDEAIKTNENLENELKALKLKYKEEAKASKRKDEELKLLGETNELLDKKLVLYIKNEMKLIKEIEDLKSSPKDSSSRHHRRCMTISNPGQPASSDAPSPDNIQSQRSTDKKFFSQQDESQLSYYSVENPVFQKKNTVNN